MERTFNSYVQEAEDLVQSLQARPLQTPEEIKGAYKLKTPGIYVFYEKDRAIYVGRTRRIKERMNDHTRLSNDHFSASFAF